MSVSFYDLMKYAKTGIASPDMTHFDKARALAAFGNAFPSATLSGVPPISFKSNGKPLTAWSISGNLYQQGTPTPDAPIVPQETGDRTANLFDSNTITFPTSTIIIYNPIYVGDGTFTLSSTIPETETKDVFFLSGNVSSGANSQNNGVSNGVSRTRQSTDGFVTVAMRYNPIRYNPADYNYMLNTGITALPYEPYGVKLPLTLAGQTSPIYLSEPIRKIGEYADSVASDGTVTRRIKKLVLTGTEYWLKIQAVKVFYIIVDDAVRTNGIVTTLCTHYNGVENTSSSFNMSNKTVAFQSTSTRLYIRDNNYEDVTDFKTYLQQQYAAGTPVTVWYVLATPTTETITAPTLTPAKGANTLTVDTTLPPSGVSITGQIKAI